VLIRPLRKYLIQGSTVGLDIFCYNWRRPPNQLSSANVAKKVKSLRFGWNATLFANAAQVMVALLLFVYFRQHVTLSAAKATLEPPLSSAPELELGLSIWFPSPIESHLRRRTQNTEPSEKAERFGLWTAASPLTVGAF